jgi:cyclophilin family peptidyl-prolyl cis-trans isomerase
VKALGKALETWTASPLIEVRSALIEASGALELLGTKSALESECRSENPTLRESAAKALGLLGARGQKCDTFTPGPLPEETPRLLREKTTMELQTDGGTVTLELDPGLAPVAATRIAELAGSGFYDGVVIHRVVPGFVVQLGDPGGDGYGGAPRPALRSELSPASFEPGSVGIALGGKDSGSSQFFVTLGRHPHLDGEYALVGRAGPGWERLAEGDVVRKVTVREGGR